MRCDATRADGRPQDENMKLTDCYFEKKDWRKCTAEVRSSLVPRSLLSFHIPPVSSIYSPLFLHHISHSRLRYVFAHQLIITRWSSSRGAGRSRATTRGRAPKTRNCRGTKSTSGGHAIQCINPSNLCIKRNRLNSRQISQRHGCCVDPFGVNCVIPIRHCLCLQFRVLGRVRVPGLDSTARTYRSSLQYSALYDPKPSN